MSITITITDPTPAQIAALFGGAADAPVDEKPARTPRKAADKPAETPAEEPKAEEPAADDVPSLDDVKAAAQKLVNANSREALAELLETYGAKNLSSLPEDKRASFIEKCENKSK